MVTCILSDAEIAAVCDGLSQPAAQIRHLRSLGLTVHTKPNGRPLVLREHFAAVLGNRVWAGKRVGEDAAAVQTDAPDETALILHFRGRHGQATTV